jgi:hypothetical protein
VKGVCTNRQSHNEQGVWTILTTVGYTILQKNTRFGTMARMPCICSSAWRGYVVKGVWTNRKSHNEQGVWTIFTTVGYTILQKNTRFGTMARMPCICSSAWRNKNKKNTRFGTMLCLAE